MSIHIEAKLGDIAETVLLPGDPKRAEYIAQNFLKDAKQVNFLRNASGFTGINPVTNKMISVLGPGMGLSNINIYGTELIVSYKVKRLIRLGTTGSTKEKIQIGDLILAMAACTDSGMNTERFDSLHFAPIANFDLLHQAYKTARRLRIPVQVGNIFATERFYKEEEKKKNWWKKWAEYGVLGFEMETSELYTLAPFYGIQALTILTVSDNLITGAQMPAKERECGRSISKMIRLALEIA